MIEVEYLRCGKWFGFNLKVCAMDVTGGVMIVLALLAAAITMTSDKVISQFEKWERQQILTVKRQVARQLYFLTTIVALAYITFPFVENDILTFEDGSESLRLNLWTMLFLCGALQMLAILWSACRLGFMLREPGGLSPFESLKIFVSLFRRG